MIEAPKVIDEEEAQVLFPNKDAGRLTPGTKTPGFYSASELRDQISNIYHEGFGKLYPTAWESLSELYKIRQGEFNVVLGVPGHGKSEFLDCLLLNWAIQYQKKVAYVSLENLPIERHIIKLVEKRQNKPFYGTSERMTEEQAQVGISCLEQNFRFYHPGELSPTPDSLMAESLALKRSWGLDGLVIDPWNELEHGRTGKNSKMTETEYISLCLSQFRRFARNEDIALWLVVHPTKLQKKEDGTYPIPSPYDAMGSSHWRNKADNFLTVYRDLNSDEPNNILEVHVQKIRFKEVGQTGKTDLKYHRLSGRLSEVDGYKPKMETRRMDLI